MLRSKIRFKQLRKEKLISLQKKRGIFCVVFNITTSIFIVARLILCSLFEYGNKKFGQY